MGWVVCSGWVFVVWWCRGGGGVVVMGVSRYTREISSSGKIC